MITLGTVPSRDIYLLHELRDGTLACGFRRFGEGGKGWRAYDDYMYRADFTT